MQSRNAVDAAAVIAVPLALRGGLLLELAGIGYAACTLGAFLISVYHGLFGFIDTPHGTPQMVSLLAEIAAIVLLGTALVHSQLAAGGRIHRPRELV